MGVDNESRFVIAFDGTSGNLDQILSALKTQFRSAVSDLQKTASSLDLYSGLLKQNADVVSAVSETKKRLQDLQAAVTAIRDAGGTVGKDLAASLRDAEKAAASAIKAYRDHRDTLQDMRKSLTAAGVDVRNLSAEQLRLAESIRVANAQALQQSNRDLLGVKNIQPQINQLNAAFNSIVASGKATFGEVSVAAANLETRVKALRDEAGSMGAAFNAAKGALLGTAVAAIAVGAAVSKTASDYRAFAQGMAAVETIAETSKAKIAELTQGVRDMARTMGVDAVASTKALYDIIGSGIRTDNSIEVLRLSTQAAIAGITDVATAAKLGVSILNAYGLEVNSLGRVYDILFKTVQDGVATFPELANSIGDVLPSARSAKVPLEEVGAAMVVLTRNGISAAESATSLTRVIQDLAAPAPEAQKALNALGIEFNGLAGTIKQFADKSLTLGQLRDLVPDVRAVKGIQTLIQNYQLLSTEIQDINGAAGTMQAAYAIMAQTPQAAVDRFNSAVKDLSISVGQFVTGASGLVQTVTGWINAFNSLSPATKNAAFETAALTLGMGALFFALSRLTVPLNLLGAALLGNAPAFTVFGQAATGATIVMTAFQAALAGLLGFKFGEALYGWSQSIRDFGGYLGTAGAFVVAFGGFVSDKLAAAFHGSAQESANATQRFKENLATIDAMDKAIRLGISESLFQLGEQLKKLQKDLGDASVAVGKATTDLQTSVTAIAASTKASLESADRVINNLNTSLTNLVAKLGDNVTAAQAALAQTTANIAAESALRTAALSKAADDEQKSAKALVDIQKQAAKDRLDALNKGSVEILAAFNTEAQARIDIAKRTAGKIDQVEQAILVAKRDILKKILDDYRQHVADLTKQDTERLAKVKELEQQRADIKQSIEDKIREAVRGTLSVYDQYYDRQKQAEEFLNKAREASLKGNLKLAEEFANKAIALGDTLSKEVKDGEAVIVDATDASTNATKIYKDAQSILLGVVDKRIATEKEGAKATEDALEKAKVKLAEFTAEYEKVAAKAAEGLKIQVDANVDNVNLTLDRLEEETKKRDLLVTINADATLAKQQIEELKKELDKGITVNLEARTDAIENALDRISENAPELELKVDEALDNIDTVKAAAKTLENVQLKIQSNIDEVQAQIDKLKENTESTHTIHIVRVEGNKAGGQVGITAASVPDGYATGGPVGFRPPTWTKVPGSGSGDIVPALLRRGSWVIRKSASQFYGDDLLQRVARFATGGKADQPSAEAAAGIHDFSPLTVPFKAILAYASFILPYLRHPMFADAVKNMGEDIRTIQGSGVPRSEKESAGKHLILLASDVAENFGLQDAWGKSATGGGPARTRALEGFAAFYERWKKNHPDDAKGFAAGGSTRDTIRAMLEPGEHVMQLPAVRKYGGAFMDALNRMLIPRERLRAMVSPPQRFATGGPVLTARAAVVPSPGGGGSALSAQGWTVNINANPGDILSTDNVRRFVVPVIDDIMRRSRR